MRSFIPPCSARHFLLALAIASAFSGAFAGTIEQAIVLAEPQMQVKDGAISGCGYRLMSATKDAPNARSSIFMDASFNLYDSGIVLLKGGAVQITKTPEGSRRTNKPIDSFWLKVDGHTPTKPFEGKVIPSETNGYLLFGVPLEAVIPFFGAITDAKPFTIGMRLKGESIDRIYTGVAQISEDDGKSAAQCFIELTNAMAQAIESTPK